MLSRNKISCFLGYFTSFIILIFGGCGPSVKTINTDNTDLSKYETFAYLPNTNAEVPEKNYTDEKINQTIIESVQKNMKKKGFNLDQKEPDLLILVSTYTDLNVETRTTPVYATYPYSYNIGSVSPFYSSYYYYGYPAYTTAIGYNTDTYTYKEGTLIIDLIDRKSKEVVWKGIASDDIYGQSSTKAIQSMVDDVLAELNSDQ